MASAVGGDRRFDRPGRLVRQVVRSLKQDLGRAALHGVLNSLAGSVLVPRVLRFLVYRACGMDIRSANISSGVTFLSRDVSIGGGVFVNWGTVFEGGPITIGERTQVGQQVAFITAHHPLDRRGRPSHEYRALPIEVGADCWLGARVTVLGGVRIADGCTVGAGSLVNRDLVEPGVYAGAPARLVKPAPAVA